MGRRAILKTWAVENDGGVQLQPSIIVSARPSDTVATLSSPPMNQLKGTIVDSKDGPAVRVSETVQIALPTAEGMGTAIGQSVIIGIRPEHVLLESDGSLPAVPLEINLIEPLGSEALIHAHVAGESFVIKTETHGDISHLNDITQFYVNVDRLKVFDEQSGSALYRPDQQRG